MMALKDLQMIYQTYKDRGIKVVAISAEAENRERVNYTVRHAGVEFPVLLDPEREVYGSYGIRVYPSTVIIDQEGKFAYSLPGHALSYRVKIEGMIRFMLGDIDRKELEKAFSPGKKDRDEQLLKAERRYNLALRFTRARLYEQAMDAARQSVGYKADFAPAHTLLGFLLLDDGDIDQAYTEFRKALDIDPDSPEATTGLGAALLRKNKTEEALEILQKNASTGPGSLMNDFELGRAYEMDGQAGKAIEIYRRILDKIVKKRVIPSAVSKCD
jgi:tetratricopeptide (TPR) repeat protein